MSRASMSTCTAMSCAGCEPVTDQRPRIARGANGAGPLRRLYRRSPARRLLRIDLAHRGLHPDDVFLASYPRSGNAWLAFIVLEMSGRRAGFDSVRFDAPIVGAHAKAPSLVPGGGRFIKTHEPYLTVYRRAIHLVRDPRDVALSYFRFMQRDGRLVLREGDDVDATFDRYLDAFIAGRLHPHGTWQAHLERWLDAHTARPESILRLRYEDMRADEPRAVAQIAQWLGLPVTSERAADIAQRCSLERMREAEREVDPQVFGRVRPEVTYIGQASVGGWRQILSAEQQHRFARFADGLAALGYEAPI